MAEKTHPAVGAVGEEVAAILRAEIARHRFTQAEVAYGAGVDQSQMSKMLRGVRPISIDQLYRVALMLRLDAWAVVRSATERANSDER